MNKKCGKISYVENLPAFFNYQNRPVHQTQAFSTNKSGNGGLVYFYEDK